MSSVKRCSICGARLTWAWIDGCRQVVCCNALWGQYKPGDEDDELEPFTIGSFPQQLDFGKER
jgi:hypothetical protein